MEYIPRVLEKAVDERLQNRKILLLLGARQVGKTTLIQHMLQSRSGQLLNMDFDVDQKRIVGAAKQDIDETVKAFGKNTLLVIDEAHRLPEIGRIVKGWYDKNLNLKVVLLGSSSDALISIAGSELVGRNEKLWLTPLLFREILKRQTWYVSESKAAHIHEFFSDQVKVLIMQHMVFGSYPEAYLSSDPRTYLQNLTTDYLLKDIFTSSIVRSPKDVRTLLIELARSIGEVVSLNQLATRTDLTRQTVKRYLDLLQGISVIFAIPSYATDPIKEINRSSKYYFWDTGVRNEMLRDWEVSEDRGDVRVLWENWVMGEIAKLRLTYLRHEDLYFWQSRNGSNVDLIVKQGSELYPFDFRFYEDEASPSRAFKNAYGLKPKTIHPGNVLDVLL